MIPKTRGQFMIAGLLFPLYLPVYLIYIIVINLLKLLKNK